MCAVQDTLCPGSYTGAVCLVRSQPIGKQETHQAVSVLQFGQEVRPGVYPPKIVCVFAWGKFLCSLLVSYWDGQASAEGAEVRD